MPAGDESSRFSLRDNAPFICGVEASYEARRVDGSTWLNEVATKPVGHLTRHRGHKPVATESIDKKQALHRLEVSSELEQCIFEVAAAVHTCYFPVDSHFDHGPPIYDRRLHEALLATAVGQVHIVSLEAQACTPLPGVPRLNRALRLLRSRALTVDTAFKLQNGIQRSTGGYDMPCPLSTLGAQ